MGWLTPTGMFQQQRSKKGWKLLVTRQKDMTVVAKYVNEIIRKKSCKTRGSQIRGRIIHCCERILNWINMMSVTEETMWQYITWIPEEKNDMAEGHTCMGRMKTEEPFLELSCIYTTVITSDPKKTFPDQKSFKSDPPFPRTENDMPGIVKKTL